MTPARVTLLALALSARVLSAQSSFEIVSRFPRSFPAAAGPLLMPADGSIYGTAPDGGAFGRGSIFVLRPDGVGGYTAEDLYSFSGPDGMRPAAGVILGADGRLYGTTIEGGAADAATFFRLNLAGHLTQLATLPPGGGTKPGRLTVASDGNLYGTTSDGGAHDAGTVFRLDGISGALTTLHEFGGPGDGSTPFSGVIPGSDGRLYGTTSRGGAGDEGTIYAIDLAGAYGKIHDFAGTDGSDPRGSFLAGSDGALYGTTTSGGATGHGTFFRITVAGDLTTLHDFLLFPSYQPETARHVIQASDGYFYGTTDFDLISGTPATFYKVDSSGNHSLVDLNPPTGDMTFAADGFIYVTIGVVAGGVARLDLSGDSTIVLSGFTPLQFDRPRGRLIESAPGTLYALAQETGGDESGGIRRDVLLQLGLSGPASIAHEFPQYNFVNADLLRLDDGTFYGTNESGPGPDGSVFKLDAQLVETDLHDFTVDDGSLPFVGPTAGPSGEIWGTTFYGGENLAGTIFKVDSLGVFTSLHSFDAGGAPYDPLVYAADGNFYGILQNDPYFLESASAFRADVQGNVTPLHDFTPGGRFPTGLFQGTDGDFYGIMATPPFDPAPGDTVFRMDSAGTVTPLHDFSAGWGRRLFKLSDGSVYGVYSNENDPPDPSHIFRMDSEDDFPTVHTFDGGRDGVQFPWPDLLLASDGNLYGTAGGFNGEPFGGAIYRLSFEATPPTLTSIEPASGRAAGGASAVLHGSHVRGPGEQVSFGSASLGAAVAPPGLLFDQATLITLAPALEPGTLNDVTLTNGDTTSVTLSAAWFADFLDVPGDDIFHESIEKIFRNGITAGCGSGLYCRDLPVTRAQMAVFLLKAKYGSAYAPPACSGHFADVPCPGGFAVDWIEQLFAEGITAGCGDGTTYCPTNPVSRQQMAVFLLKTEHGSAYAPPACAGVFSDVACPSLFADWIEQLAAENITAGCGGGLYCPADPNTRGQMAVFLSTTFDLP